MKIVHASDLHLDSPLVGLERYEGAPVEAIRGATRRAFENLVTVCLEEHAALLLLARDLNVGLLHTSLNGREGHDDYAPCTAATLTNRGYDYWALGHVHRREVVSSDPYVVYSGNLQGRNARETGAKGATIVEVHEGRVTG